MQLSSLLCEHLLCSQVRWKQKFRQRLWQLTRKRFVIFKFGKKKSGNSNLVLLTTFKFWIPVIKPKDVGKTQVCRTSNFKLHTTWSLLMDTNLHIVKLDLALTSRAVKFQFQVAHSKQIKTLIVVIISSWPPNGFTKNGKRFPNFHKCFSQSEMNKTD